MYKISVSKTKTFESCKKKFHYNYILKLKPKDFTFFTYGKFLHKVLEDFHLEIINGTNEPQNKIAARCYKEALKEYGPKLSKDDIAEAYGTVDAYLKRLSEEENPAEILLVEKNFNINIDDMVSVIGMVDRVQKDQDGMLHVIDYKTSKNMKYYKDDFFQMQVYSFVMMTEDPSLQRIRCSYMFLRHDFCCITKEFNREEIMEMKGKFIEYASNMQNEKEFAANPNFLCAYCGYNDVCAEGKAVTRTKKIKNGETSWI